MVLDPELDACMPGSGSILIVGRVTLDKLGLSLNKQLFQLSRMRRAATISAVEGSGYSSSRRVMHSVSVFQRGRNVEPEPDKAVEQFLFRGPGRFTALEDERQECRAAPDRVDKQTPKKG